MNTVITFGEGLLKAKCIEIKDEGIRVFEMIYDGIFYEILDQLGTMPLPPYIKEKLEDKNRLQTVYCKLKEVQQLLQLAYILLKKSIKK